MANSNVDPHAFKAVIAASASSLEGKEFHYVKFNSAEELELCTEGAVGFVLVEGPTKAGYGTIVVGAERQKVVLGASVKIGEALMSNSEGKAVKATGSNVVLGVALATGVSNQLIETLTAPPASAVA